MAGDGNASPLSAIMASVIRPWHAVILSLLLASCRPCAPLEMRRDIQLAFMPGGPVPDLHLGYTRIELGGGLRALVAPTADGAPFTLSLWIRAGTDDEASGESGASHLARLSLLDPATCPEAAGASQRIHAAGGQVEARTTRRYTVVTVHAPAGRISEAIEVLGPFLRPPALPGEALVHARKALRHEADGSWASPRALEADAIHSLMLGPSPGSSLYPAVADADATDAGAVHAYMKRTYTQGRMVLGASMPVGLSASLGKLAHPHKGAGPSGTGYPGPGGIVVRALEPPDTTGDDARSLVVAGIVLPALGTQAGAASHLVARWLAEPGTGTVLESLGEMGKLFQGLEVEVEATADGNLVTVGGAVEPGNEVEAVQAIALALARASLLPPTPSSLERAAIAAAAAWARDVEDPLAAPSRLAAHEHLCAGSPTPEDHILGLFDVGEDEAGAILRRVIEDGSIGFVIVPARAEGHDPPRPIDTVAAEAEARSAIGRMLVMADGPCQPGLVAIRTPGSTVAISGLLGSGSLNETPGREGTAKLLSLMLARRLERAVRESPGLDPAFVTASSVYSPDHVGVHLVVPADRWREGLLAVRSALLAPGLDASSFEEARQKCIATAHLPDDGSTLSMRSAMASILGLGHGYDPEGSVASLGTTSAAEVSSFHLAALEAGLAVALAGDLDPDDACPAASIAFALSRPAGSAATLVAPTPVVAAPSQMVVEGPGSTVFVTVAWAIPGASSADAFPLLALAEILGHRLRSIVAAKGLASLIDVEIWTARDFGILAVRAEAPAPNAAALRAAVSSAASSLEDSPPSVEELEGARERILADRAQALALPATAARLLALEELRAGGVVPADAETALSVLESDRIAELAAAYLATPVVTALAP